jgi:hypothetical protein
MTTLLQSPMCSYVPNSVKTGAQNAHAVPEISSTKSKQEGCDMKHKWTKKHNSKKVNIVCGINQLLRGKRGGIVLGVLYAL